MGSIKTHSYEKQVAQVATIDGLKNVNTSIHKTVIVQDQNHGGVFNWKPDKPKIEHDGGIFYDPLVLSVAGWVYESANAGNGVFERQVRDELNVKDFGAIQGQDLLQVLQKMNQVCTNTRKNMVCRLEGTLTETLRLTLGLFNIDFSGSKLTSNKNTSGYALELAPHDTGQLPEFNTVYEVKGINLRPGEVGTDQNGLSITDGLSIGRQVDQFQGETGRMSYVNFIVANTDTRFRHNWTWLNDTFINTVINPFSSGGFDSSMRFLTQTNAGENINIHGGVIANAHNNTDTGVNLLMEPNSNADVYLNGTSIDYGDKQIVMYAGAIHGVAHLENNSYQTDIELIETNNQPIIFNLSGGTIATGPLGGVSPAPEPANGKAYRIKSTGSKVTISLSGVGNSLRDKFDTEMIHIVSGTPVIKVDAPFYDTSVDKPAILSRYLNRVRNGNFEVGTQSWQLNGASGASIAESTAQVFDGSKSLELVGTTGTSFSVLQQFMPSCNTRQLTRFQCKITSYTSGSIQLVLRFFDWQGTLVGTRTGTVEANSIGDWKLLADTSSMPSDTHTFEVQIKANAFIGTAYIDDVVCNTF